MRKIDRSALIGNTYGKWTVTGFPKTQNLRHPAVLCRCECGRESSISVDNLLSGKSKGCRDCSGRNGSANPAWKGYKDIPHVYFTIMMRSAQARGLVVNVTIEDLQVAWDRCGGKCVLTGLPIELKGKKSGNTASIDRIDPAHGYEPWNIQWVHKDVNLMRNKFTLDYFIRMCALVADRGNSGRRCAAGS